MKASELRTAGVDELTKLVAKKRAELVEKHRALKSGELANPRIIRNMRKEIAQLLTVINQQEKK